MGTLPNDILYKRLFDDLKLDSSFKDLEYGGLIKQLELTFRVPYSTENQQVLYDLLGNDWETYVVESLEAYDEGIDEDTFSGEIVTTTEEEYTTTHYKFYRFRLDKFSTMTGERLLAIWQKYVSFVVETEQPCPYDQILIVVAVIILTILSAGAFAIYSPAWWAVIAGGVISVGQTVGAFGERETEYLQYAQLALAVYSGYEAWKIAVQEGATLATFNFAINIASTAVQGVSIYEQQQTTEELDDLQKETEQYQELLAEEFEQTFRFYYGESYEYMYRNGHEKDPYEGIRAQFSRFSVY